MKHLLVLIGLMLSSVTFAADTDFGRATYTGDRGHEVINLMTETTRTEYRNVQVPYQERVCRFETRYRQECHQEPGRQVCRQEPGRQVCRQQPPTRSCRTRPDGRQVCTTQPGRQVCRQEPGRRVCHQEPGRRVCRQVPYQEQVCRMETRYRYERRPYTVVDQRTYADISFTFNHAVWENLGIQVDLTAELQRDILNVRAEDFSSPGMLLKDVVRRSDTGGRVDRRISEHHTVSLLEADKLLAPMRDFINNSDIMNGTVRVNMSEVAYPADTVFSMRIMSNGTLFFDRTLVANEYRIITNAGGRSQVELDLRRLAAAIPKGAQLTIDFTVSANPSDFLNAWQHSGWSKTHSFSAIYR